MSAYRALTLRDLESVVASFIADGVDLDTKLFCSRDDEGNGFHLGLDFQLDDNGYEVCPYGAADYRTEGPSITSYPGGPMAEPLWEDED
jgi:hypothetical protein